LAVEKRVVFKSWWLPWVLMAPQVAPSSCCSSSGRRRRRCCSRVQQSDAFGTSVEWVGLENFRNLFADPTYLASFKTTARVLGAGGRARPELSLLLAVMADRVVKGAMVYKTLLIWPYAVAPAVAGVLWLFMFAPSVGVVATLARHGASTGTTCSTAPTP
jgi:sn-glycerol 3-phosphate transport system permease protein